MNEEHNKKNQVRSHLVSAVDGFTSGSWSARNRLDLFKRSRAERDYPDEAENAYDEIVDLLDEWKSDEECSTEEDFTWDLADYFGARTNLQIEVWPDTPEGKPQILISNLIAIELKINPSSNEMERWIEQGIKFSQSWITWILILDAPQSKTVRLKQLLIDKGIEQIIVWNFPLN